MLFNYRFPKHRAPQLPSANTTNPFVFAMDNSADSDPDPAMCFRLLAPVVKDAASRSGPRLGRLSINKVTLETPTFVAPASRGAVPHLSHDNLRDHTNIKGIYVALEDCKPLKSSLSTLHSINRHQSSRNPLPMSQFITTRAPSAHSPPPPRPLSLSSPPGVSHLLQQQLQILITHSPS